MFIQSNRRGRIIIIIFLCIFAATFTLMEDDAFARKGDRKGNKSSRITSQQERGPARSSRVSRHRGKRRVVSPRKVRHGQVVKKLPRWYGRAWHRRVPYYYYGGVFYRPAPPGFVVVGAPAGAIVAGLPVGYTRIWVGSVGYYTYGGVFYRRVPSGYVVVESPPEVIVDEVVPTLVQPPESAAGQAAVTASILNVRSGPALSYPVIYQIHRGYILDIYGKADEWLYVELPNGEFGWVMAEFTHLMKSPGSG